MKLLLLFLVYLIATLAQSEDDSTPATDEADCCIYEAQPLTGGQTINTGSVVYSFNPDTSELTISITAEGDWTIQKAHIWVGSEFPAEWYNKAPSIGHDFPFHFPRDDIYSPPVSYLEVIVPVLDVECGQPLVILVHTETLLLNGDGVVIQEETSFSGPIDPHPKSRWIRYGSIDLCCVAVDDCDAEPEPEPEPVSEPEPEPVSEPEPEPVSEPEPEPVSEPEPEETCVVENCATYGEVCTSADCDEVDGCVIVNHAPGIQCSDSLWCTINDACVGDGSCAGTARSCPDDDNNVCTAPACEELYIDEGHCTFVNVEGACDDTDECTLGDGCVDGSCAAGTTRDCTQAAYHPCGCDLTGSDSRTDGVDGVLDANVFYAQYFSSGYVTVWSDNVLKLVYVKYDFYPGVTAAGDFHVWLNVNQPSASGFTGWLTFTSSTTSGVFFSLPFAGVGITDVNACKHDIYFGFHHGIIVINGQNYGDESRIVGNVQPITICCCYVQAPPPTFVYVSPNPVQEKRADLDYAAIQVAIASLLDIPTYMVVVFPSVETDEIVVGFVDDNGSLASSQIASALFGQLTEEDFISVGLEGFDFQVVGNPGEYSGQVQANADEQPEFFQGVSSTFGASFLLLLAVLFFFN